ncbi:MAG: multiubiquitin domain-containing protein, partial [Sneathiella sp.]
MQNVVDIENWVRDQGTAQVPEAKFYRVRLWDGDGFDEKRTLSDPKPTARQVLEAFERYPADEFELMFLSAEGELQSIDLSATIDLREKGPERFFAFRTDRLLSFVVNGQRMSWGADRIEVALVRCIAQIPDDHALYLEHVDLPDQELAEDEHIRLDGQELE